MGRARRLAVLAIATAALVAGCQQAPTPPPRLTLSPDLLGEARQAMGRGDYDTSARLLRQVIGGAADNLEAHYRLAVSASYLELGDEAVGQFEWVVAHGEPNAAEVQIARDWLRASRSEKAARAESPEAPTTSPDRAAVTGRVVWDTDGSLEPKRYLRLFMKGLKGTPVEEEFYRVETNEQGTYRIADVMPGEYVLTSRVAGPPIWRLKVAVKAGESLQLDLSPDNSVKVRDDFPNDDS
jgi:hypothetical protein